MITFLYNLLSNWIEAGKCKKRTKLVGRRSKSLSVFTKVRQELDQAEEAIEAEKEHSVELIRAAEVTIQTEKQDIEQLGKEQQQIDQARKGIDQLLGTPTE